MRFALWPLKYLVITIISLLTICTTLTSYSSVKIAESDTIQLQIKARLNLLNDTCSSKRLSSLKLRTNHLIVDDIRKVIYCYVPKAGSTNWKRVLLAIQRHPLKDPLSIEPHVGHKKRWKFLNTLSDLSTLYSNYTRFLIVRHPLERLLSTYRNKFEFAYSDYFRNRYGKKIVAKYESNNVRNNNGIPKFLHYLQFIAEQTASNEHWQSIYEMCLPCHIRYDYIGKYESLQEDSEFILDQIMPNGRRKWKFPNRKQTYSTKPTKELMAIYYRNVPNSLTKRLLEIYGDDLDLFGYRSFYTSF